MKVKIRNVVAARLILAMAAALTVGALCGCGSLTLRTKGAGSPYCGVGYDLEKVASREEWFDWSIEGWVGDCPVVYPRALLCVMDVPMSFILDTLLLPLDALAFDDPSD